MPLKVVFISRDHQMFSYLKKIKFLHMMYRWAREMGIYTHLFTRKSNLPDIKFVLFAQGRTGSDLLNSLINSHPAIYCDEEILNHKVLFPMTFVKGKYALSPRNVYGFKLKIYHVTGTQKIDNPKQFMSDLYQQGWKVIYLERRNTLRQVISGFVVRKRTSFHYRLGDGSLALGKIRIDCGELTRNMRNREIFSAMEKEVLKDLPHIAINYEDHLLRAEEHQKTLDNIFAFLGVPSVPVKTDLLRITPDRLSDFIENYKEVIQTLEKTEYSEFLVD